VDLLRRLARDLLDLDTALRGGHEDHALGTTVDDRAQVELGGDLAGLLDQHAVDRLPARVGLVRHQVLAEHPPGRRGGRIGIVDELHAAGLAAPAGVHLRLDDPALAGELAHRRAGLGLVADDLAVGDGQAVLAKQLLRLVFVEVHGGVSGGFVRCAASCSVSWLRDGRGHVRELSAVSRAAAVIRAAIKTRLVTRAGLRARVSGVAAGIRACTAS
jgi:hypothetical protein